MLILGTPCSIAGAASTYLGTGMPCRFVQITRTRLFDELSSLSSTFVLLPSADLRYLITRAPYLFTLSRSPKPHLFVIAPHRF